MGILGLLFGKTSSMNIENLSNLASAASAMRKEGLSYAGKAGLCLKAPGKSTVATESDIAEALTDSRLRTGYSFDLDDYGYTWIVLRGDLPGTLEAIGLIYPALKAARYARHVLCIAFEFRKDGRKVYWIYNKKGRFYPFVPDGQERDNETELRLRAQMPESFPVESYLGHWYPVWDMPF